MTVKREFVPPRIAAWPSPTSEIPIGCGQVIAQAGDRGKILQALRVTKSDTVLEIGTGSGWFAALLAARAEWVRTMEIEPSW